MATYFHGSSEIQAAAAAAAPSDGIQTLYLMNPNCLSSYTDASSQQHHHHQPPNMLFFNPANGLNHATLAHAPPQSHHLVGIPLPSPASADPDNHCRSSSLHGVVPAGIHYNLWGSMDQSQQVSSVAATTDSGGPQDVISSQMEFRRPLVMSPVRQGLSLSLSSQQAQRAPQAAYRSITNEHEAQAMHGSGHVSPISPGTDIRVSGNSPSSVSAVSNGVLSFQSVVLGSKYLRAAQELLDEVVNVGKGMKGDSKEGTKEKKKTSKESATADGSSSAAGGESSAKPGGAELTTAQRQELQMKKAKLVNMLDEVEHRYRQYHLQMQVVVSAFEQAAGFGAAKSYTALALQTISKQFRCLKDAISAQIKATTKNLGEEDCLGAKAEGSRLRYVDHQLRQQRALQHLGMMQHNAWRPQRGLPERAVSILRAWLFEHFLHPYPKDSDKQMLAKQTGLTRSQVSNWFINARVRLWKPMVEEMYLEEVKEHEKNNDSAENSSKNENKEAGTNSSTAAGERSSTLQMDQVRLRALHSKPEKSSNQNASPTEFSNSTISMSPVGGSGLQPQAGFTLIRPSHQMEGVSQRSPNKKPKGGGDMQNSPSSILSMEMDMKHGEVNREITVSFGGERLTKDGYPMITSTASNGGGFGAYPMGDLGRFNPDHLAPPRFAGNGVSLTLGLPHADNHLSLSGPHHQQNFLSNQSIHLGRRLEIGIGDDHQPDFSSNGFENLGDIQNRKGFAAQLLPDFVA